MSLGNNLAFAADRGNAMLCHRYIDWLTARSRCQRRTSRDICGLVIYNWATVALS